MSYLVLARKYRPRTFGEVTGQEVVTRTLQGAIAEERIAHAYLFCGPRGTGKTTTARIFAKALNCERGPAADPCNECERCRAADAGSEIDLVEIDAASHTSVEDVRALREQAAYVPLRARFKVYLVDEVHMLSRNAFNALLKTLEEPPPHVKFLFATTEPHRLPDTVLSRCQVLKLAPLAEDTIAARLDEVFRLEGVRPKEGVSRALARRARGGMRDALSLADQLLALVGDEPGLDDVQRLSAAADREALETLLELVRTGDPPSLLAQLPRSEGAEPELLDALLAHLRHSLLLHHCGVETPIVDEPMDARRRMADFAAELGPDRLELWLEELLAARERMRELPSQARLVLELCLLGLARPEATLGLADLAERLLELERRLAAVPPAMEPAASTSSAPPERTAAPRPPAAVSRRAAAVPRPPVVAEESSAPPPARSRSAASARTMRSSSTEAWRGFLEALQQASPSLEEILRRCGRLVEFEGGRAVVRLDGLREADRALVADGRNRRRCEQVLSKLVDEPVKVELVDAAGLRPGTHDPFTREVADLFGGRIED